MIEVGSRKALESEPFRLRQALAEVNAALAQQRRDNDAQVREIALHLKMMSISLNLWVIVKQSRELAIAVPCRSACCELGRTP